MKCELQSLEVKCERTSNKPRVKCELQNPHSTHGMAGEAHHETATVVATAWRAEDCVPSTLSGSSASTSFLAGGLQTSCRCKLVQKLKTSNACLLPSFRSVDQSDQSINRSINQSISISRYINRSIDQPVNQSLNRSTIQSQIKIASLRAL